MKFNSRVEGISEGCFEGVEVSEATRKNSVKGQRASLPIQIHPNPTAAQTLR